MDTSKAVPRQCYCGVKGCAGGVFPDCGCCYTTSDDGIHFCDSHRRVNLERPAAVAELLEAAKDALVTLDYYDQQAEFGFHGPLRKALEQAIAKAEQA